MRHAATTALAAILLAALTACGSGSDDKPAAKPSPSKTVDKAGQFLKTAHGITYNGSPTDEELLDYPQQWCDGLDQGHSVKWLFTMFGDGGGLYPIGDAWGTKKADAYTLLVAGVKAYCPANLSDVKEQVRAGGDY